MINFFNNIKIRIRKSKIIKILFQCIENKNKKKEFRRDFIIFYRMFNISKREFKFNWDIRLPFLDDKTEKTSFDKIYLFHISWAARILGKIKPVKHIDISSSVYFSAIVSAFIPIEFYDYRPADIKLDNLNCLKGNLLKLPFKNNSILSISCMHVVEHIGLGRYGDMIDSDGDLKAINELKRVLAKRGNLLFVVPIGKPTIQFNAHRIYSYRQIINYFQGFKLKQFSLIPDLREECSYIIKNATEEFANEQDYACGCFWFIK